MSGLLVKEYSPGGNEKKWREVKCGVGEEPKDVVSEKKLLQRK